MKIWFYFERDGKDGMKKETKGGKKFTFNTKQLKAKL